MLWRLVQSLGGQVRIAAGFGGASVIGWDMTAVLAMGQAMGLPAMLLADVMPAIEATMVRAIPQGQDDGN